MISVLVEYFLLVDTPCRQVDMSAVGSDRADNSSAFPVVQDMVAVAAGLEQL